MLQELNKSLTDRLNPESNHEWLFAENSKEEIKISPRQFADFNAKVFSGVAGWRKDVISFLRGSYNHAGGLQILLPHVQTRFLVCTEPDFFIIRPNWILEMTELMSRKRISFFGAPYDPRRYNMYRYFPHIAFIAVDLSRIDKSTLDFYPPDASASFAHRIKKFLLGKRANINTRRDTGSKIYERYHRIQKSECLQPVFQKKPGLLDKFFPENLSFVPKKKDYCSTKGFSDFGLPDFRNLFQWEAYMYHDEPYAFHMQGSKEKKDMEKEAAALSEFISTIK